mgnify:CR=1 FL=1
MRTILCYGDSNTHGQIPGGTPLDRYTLLQRWPGVLARELGKGWHIIEEGLSGRTTVHDDPIEGALKNGRTYLRPCLMSHAPLDLVIIMLGTNDLKARFSQPASEVAMGIGCLIHRWETPRPRTWLPFRAAETGGRCNRHEESADRKRSRRPRAAHQGER